MSFRPFRAVATGGGAFRLRAILVLRHEPRRGSLPRQFNTTHSGAGISFPDTTSRLLTTLNIAGQNFAYGTANYPTAPTLLFEYGEFKGMDFALTPGAGFAYKSIVGSLDTLGDNIITAIQAGTAQQFVAAPVPQQFVKFDFTGVATGSDYVNKLTFADGSNKEIVIMFSVILPAVLAAMPATYELDYSALPAANTTAGYKYVIVFSYKGEPDVRVETYHSGKSTPQKVADDFWESLDDPTWRINRDGLRITIYGYDDVRIAKLVVEGNGPKPLVRRVLVIPEKKK